MSAVVLNPLGANLVIALEPEPELSSIIAVQKSTVGLARFGIVQSVGPDVRDVAKGQRILASITAGVELNAGIIMIAESAVMGIAHE